ncbi:hypothetical protein CMQ_4940 [Grosmannia clavigera kw1407]|uniref:Uncharacterized protein n=1 Tax=Grosmannia clavigera (strain kw1407 / UAMH 11150) TaxID=655863 RepID=F0XK61_GROCL|nr:uncharacterized protein CMQ_4940 [Grosmannia clavigera kw1407]EFX01869.1 hypothetical protein CMQ_4940 [Grosmannia clavigera kw1407]
MGSENKLSTQVEDPTKPDAPKHEHGNFEAAKTKFQAYQANPGPAVPSGFNVAQEGSKEERRKRAQELNKEN